MTHILIDLKKTLAAPKFDGKKASKDISKAIDSMSLDLRGIAELIDQAEDASPYKINRQFIDKSISIIDSTLERLEKQCSDLFKYYKTELSSVEEIEAGYTEEQWKELDEKTKKQYIKDHPNSKYAQKDKPSEKKAPKAPAQKPISKERPTSFPNVNVEIEEWKDDADSVGGTYDEDAKDIEYWLDQMYNIKDAKYGTDGNKNFVSVQNPNDGKIYNIVIDHSGVDIMNEDMSDSVLNEHTDLTNGNGYIDRYETEKYGLGLPTVRALTDLGFGQELDYHDFNQPADIDNVKVDEPEDEFLDDEGNMTTEQAKRYWKNHHDDDPILQDYDSFEDWYKESKENGYIKD